MPLTKDFKSIISDRAQRDNEFSNALLNEAINELLTGDVNLGKAIIRDYSND